MWICTSNAFLSVVQPAPEHKQTGDVLMVRARRKGDIESVFPKAKVIRTEGRDYLFRAFISRELVAEAMAEQVRSIEYTNFKASVKSRPLHDAFMRVWQVMAGLQPVAPYSRGNTRQGRML